MPYQIVKRRGARPWKIINKATGKQVGSSVRKRDAEASARIRMAGEGLGMFRGPKSQHEAWLNTWLPDLKAAAASVDEALALGACPRAAEKLAEAYELKGVVATEMFYIAGPAHTAKAQKHPMQATTRRAFERVNALSAKFRKRCVVKR